jgi:hypothetical protein
VNVRDLVVTPQTAAYDVVQAFGTRDIRKIAGAIRDGVGAVVRAPITFAGAVVRDIADEVGRVLRPKAPRSTPTNLAAPAAAERRVAAPAAKIAEPEPEVTAPIKKLRTTRTVKKPGRPSLAVAEDDTTTADLSADRTVSAIAPKESARPDSDTDSDPDSDSNPAAGDPAEKDAA